MINVIGLGYIGLPTALMMASHGVEVIGTDNNTELITTLNRGEVSFEEKGLKNLYDEAKRAGIQFTKEYQTTDMYIVSVPTPYDRVSKKIDPCYVISAVKSILKVCLKKTVIVIESTVSPGTIELSVRPLIEENGFVVGKDIHLVHAPERIIPGNMIYEMIHNNRTIGADDRIIGEKVAQYYAVFCQGQITITSIKTAEMTKVVENSYRAVNIAFANEIARICSQSGLDVYDIIRICNLHPRVSILQPGPGVGGHCIPVDPWFLVGDYPDQAKMLREAMNVNESMPIHVSCRIEEIMREKGMVDYAKVGLYGLSYKENVDDYRESPTLQLLDYRKRKLLGSLKVYDPWIEKSIIENQYHEFGIFLDDCDFIVIMVKHDHIKKNMDKLKGKIILDCCNICDFPNVYHL